MTSRLTHRALLWSSLILLTLFGFFLIEVGFYFLIPPKWVQFAPDYRLHPKKTTLGGLGRGVSRYYYQADPLLGFDITPLAKGTHFILDGVENEIFANDLGCFDRNRLEDFSASKKDYVYFAGDSFTWGFARYEDKFATVWENNTGILAAKCGVGHTGTIHQFGKFKKIIETIGRLPTVVFVGFFPNDVINDFTFPHSMVIDGFLADTVFQTGKQQVIRIPDEERIREVSRQIKALDEPETEDSQAVTSFWMHTKIFLLRHSLLTNISNALFKKVLPEKHSPSTENLRTSIYRLFDDSEVLNEFSLSPFAEATKKAIKAWGKDAKSQGYHLVFLLIPPRSDFNNADFFKQVKEFLRDQKIDFIDFAPIFKERGWSREDLYWKIDQHLNDEGNRRMGLELSRLNK